MAGRGGGGVIYECFYNLKLAFKPLINIVTTSFRCLAKCWLNRYDNAPRSQRSKNNFNRLPTF